MIKINDNSPNNGVFNDFKFMLFLEGFGYLSNDTAWTNVLDIGGSLSRIHFQENGDIAKFDEMPLELLDRVAPSIMGGIRIHREFTIRLVEEISP